MKRRKIADYVNSHKRPLNGANTVAMKNLKVGATTDIGYVWF
jgi:hypothetical protein